MTDKGQGQLFDVDEVERRMSHGRSSISFLPIPSYTKRPSYTKSYFPSLHSRPASRCPLGDSSHGPIVSPAWARAAHSGWLGAAARHPTPVCPVALAILRPACCRQGARPAAGRGVGRRSAASPPRGCIPDETVAK